MDRVSPSPAGHADVRRPRLDSAAPMRSVLIVDDEAGIRLMFSKLLCRHGYEVRSTPTAAEALAILDSGGPPDAILLDVRLPGTSGLTLLQHIRHQRRWRHLPVLLLTGSLLSEEEEAVVRHSGAYVFYKPGNPLTIVEQLRSVAPVSVLAESAPVSISWRA